MTRLMGALVVLTAVAGCADTTMLATKDVSAPVAENRAAGMNNPFPGLLPQ